MTSRIHLEVVVVVRVERMDALSDPVLHKDGFGEPLLAARQHHPELLVLVAIHVLAERLQRALELVVVEEARVDAVVLAEGVARQEKLLLQVTIQTVGGNAA